MFKNNKLVIGILLTFLIVFISIVSFRIGLYIIKPDAVVSLAAMDMEISVNGFSGFSKAEVKVKGNPQILELKDLNKKIEITKALNQYKVRLSKKDNVKNGDTIKAILEFPLAKDFKIQYDMEALGVEKIVRDIPELIKNFEDIKNYKDKMDVDAKRKLSSSYVLRDAENLKIEEVAIYEKKVTDDMLKDEQLTYNQLGDVYRLNILYKVMGENKMLHSRKFEKYALVAFKSFRKKGKEFNYEINSVHIYADGEKLENIEKIYVSDGLEKLV